MTDRVQFCAGPNGCVFTDLYTGAPLDKCRYCGRDASSNSVAALASIEDALRIALHALESHERWCGFNRDAPGDESYNRAIEAIRAVLEPHAIPQQAKARMRQLRRQKWGSW